MYKIKLRYFKAGTFYPTIGNYEGTFDSKHGTIDELIDLVMSVEEIKRIIKLEVQSF